MEFIWIAVAISSGLLYSLSGHFKGWYQAWRNDQPHTFETKKMGKNAVIGFVLGIVIVLIQPVSEALLGSEFAIPTITTFAQFVSSVVATIGPIMLVDKWLLASKQ